MTEQDHPKISDQSCSDYEAFFLEALDMFPWFANIGNPIEGQDVRQVFSLKKAWECTQDDSWTYASFHADVDQSHALWAKAYDRALESVNNSGRNYELQEGIQVGLQAAWDAAGAAYQIATGNRNGFYVKLMEWYRAGHWPCGWEGTYPDGRLIVY